MERNLKEALKHRRSYYAIDNQTTIPDAEIEEILDFAALHTPSAFNSQSTRMVLLLREQHRRLWDIVRNTLKKTIPAAAYASTEAKINKSFAAGYGTVLFFEDTAIIEGLQKAFPLYHEKFPQWSQHTSGMHQLAVWTMLEDAGFGASLQHYNPLIDEAVRSAWSLARRRGYCHLEITCHLGIDCTNAFRFTTGTTPKERIQTFMRQGKGI